MREVAMHESRSTPRAGGARRISPLRVGLLAAGIALVVVFSVRVGAAQLVRQFAHAGPRAFWLFVPYAVGTAVGAFPWRWLLWPEDRPSVTATVLGRFAASSANALLPFFGLAGEPSRLLWMRSATHARGFAAIVVDRILYNTASGLLLFGAAVWLGTSTPLPRVFSVAALVAGAAIVLVTVGAFWTVQRVRLGERLQGIVHRLLRQSYAPAGLGSEVDSAIRDLARGSRRKLVLGTAVHGFGRTILALEVPLGLWILGAHFDVSAAATLAIMPIALSLVFSLVPSQIGIQEGAQTLMASTLHLDPALVLALVLLQRVRQLVFALLLPIIVSTARPRSPAPA